MKKTPQQCIAGNLKYLRTYYGYTQQNMADLMHVSRSAYGFLESGERVPRLDLLIRLSEIFHIRIDTFFESDTQTFVREITLASGKNVQTVELISLYNQLSPFAQGCLFEKASELLLQEKAEKAVRK